MTAANVHWTAFRRFGSVDGLRDGHLYVIAGARRSDRRWTHIKPLYIGMAYRSAVSDRVQQEHTAYRWVHEQQSLIRGGRELIVAAGEVNRTTQARVTKALVEDVEAMLIFGSQPKFNTKSKSTYSGRTPLLVVNSGPAADIFPQPFVCCRRHFRDFTSKREASGDCGA